MEGKRYANEHRPKELYLDNTLVSNFRLSYQFSQGDQPLQHELMVAIARKYNPEEFIQKFPTSQFLDEELWGKIGKIKLPTPHVTAMGGADGDVILSDSTHVWQQDLFSARVASKVPTLASRIWRPVFGSRSIMKKDTVDDCGNEVVMKC